MKVISIAAFTLAMLLGGCSSQNSADADSTNIVGSDRDAHGLYWLSWLLLVCSNSTVRETMGAGEAKWFREHAGQLYKILWRIALMAPNKSSQQWQFAPRGQDPSLCLSQFGNYVAGKISGSKSA